jgi:hypothetical protein
MQAGLKNANESIKALSETDFTDGLKKFTRYCCVSCATSEKGLAMVDRTQFTVFGNPGDELRGLLDGSV